MAKQVINIGTTANDGTGDALRTAFDKANQNFSELYTDDTNDVSSIVATAPIARNNATGIVTISLNDAGIVTDKIADDAVTADKLANSINTEIAANTAKVTNATHTGDVTGATALTIADDAVTADKLANSINSEIAANTAKVTNATHTGDVTGSAALTIANDAVNMDKIADSIIVTESEGIGSNDNDTTLPTSAAVKDYVDTNDALAGFSKTDGNFLVANGSAFVVENGSTARDSIGLGTANHAQFHCLGVGQAASTYNGQIDATTVYASTLGKDAGDKITFTTDTQIDFFVNANNKARLEADGDWQVAGDVVAISTAFSDKRLKENIKPIEKPLEAIEKLNGVTYDWKANGKSSIGVIAQDVQKVHPCPIYLAGVM